MASVAWQDMAAAAAAEQLPAEQPALRAPLEQDPSRPQTAEVRRPAISTLLIAGCERRSFLLELGLVGALSRQGQILDTNLPPGIVSRDDQQVQFFLQCCDHKVSLAAWSLRPTPDRS